MLKIIQHAADRRVVRSLSGCGFAPCTQIPLRHFDYDSLILRVNVIDIGDRSLIYIDLSILETTKWQHSEIRMLPSPKRRHSISTCHLLPQAAMEDVAQKRVGKSHQCINSMMQKPPLILLTQIDTETPIALLAVEHLQYRLLMMI